MSDARPQKILIVQTAFIGDVILATGIIKKLHAHFPTATIDVLVRKGNESLFNGHPYINRCWVWDKKENKLRNLWKLIRLVRSSHYDLLVNLQRFFSSGFLTALSGAKETRGFSNNPMSFFFSKKMPHIIGTAGSPGVHEIQRNHSLIEDITDANFCKPELFPTSGDELAIVKYLEKPFITISPTSVWFTKQVPAEVWISFIHELNNTKIYLLGGPGDVAACQQIVDACPGKRIIILAGKLSLLQSAALMKHAAMNYTNDSAPLHLCSAVNAPVVGVFCSTIPEFGFGPVSDHSFVVEKLPRPECKPCGLHGYKSCPKGHFDCSKIEASLLLEKLK